MKTFSLSGHEDGTVTAPINFAFLGIMDKHVTDYSMLDKDYWNRTKISGKDNLFVRIDEEGQETTDMNEKYTQSNLIYDSINEIFNQHIYYLLLTILYFKSQCIVPIFNI